MRKRYKEKLIELALFPVGFISNHIFGKSLVFTHFAVKKRDDFVCQEIAKNIKISSEWSEFVLEPPLKVNKKYPTIQIFIEAYEKIYLNYLTKTDESQDTYFFYKPILPNGIIINPKVQLIDEYKETYDLEFTWYAYCLGFTEKLPKDRKYIKLRISSDTPFNSYLIRWFDWTPADQK